MPMMIIAEDCTNCDLCLDPCPTDAIHEPDDEHTEYWIETSKCNDCLGELDDGEKNCVASCPLECIELDGEETNPELM